MGTLRVGRWDAIKKGSTTRSLEHYDTQHISNIEQEKSKGDSLQDNALYMFHAMLRLSMQTPILIHMGRFKILQDYTRPP